MASGRPVSPPTVTHKPPVVSNALFAEHTVEHAAREVRTTKDAGVDRTGFEAPT